MGTEVITHITCACVHSDGKQTQSSLSACAVGNKMVSSGDFTVKRFLSQECLRCTHECTVKKKWGFSLCVHSYARGENLIFVGSRMRNLKVF